MKWKQPPVIKIYEALGTIADERIEVKGFSGKVYSSSGNKFYEVVYDPTKQAIMANDNASYWKGALGYPSIALLLKLGILEYREDLAGLIKGVAWKDLNQAYKNDFEKTLHHIKSTLTQSEWESLSEHAEHLLKKVVELDLSQLGKRKMPPQEY